MAGTNPDIIIVGRGITGCVVASRLHEQDPLLSILVLEAGSDVTEHPLVARAATAPFLLRSVLDWRYSTVPQRHLEQSILLQHAGKAPGGGSAINSAECPRYITRALSGT